MAKPGLLIDCHVHLNNYHESPTRPTEPLFTRRVGAEAPPPKPDH